MGDLFLSRIGDCCSVLALVLVCKEEVGVLPLPPLSFPTVEVAEACREGFLVEVLVSLPGEAA